MEVSWSNIQNVIASFLQATAKGKIGDKDEIVSIKLEHPGGFIPEDKLLKLDLIVEKGVKTQHFG